METRTQLLQQVMSTFAQRHPTGSILQLTNAYNFTAWRDNLRFVLSAEKGGIVNYFDNGDLGISSYKTVNVTNEDNTTTTQVLTDAEVDKLKRDLDNFLNVILMASVDSEIIKKYRHRAGSFGLQLLKQITADYGKLSSVKIFKLFQVTINKVLNGENFTNKEVHSLLHKLRNASLTSDQILGLMVLLMTPDQERAKILTQDSSMLNFENIMMTLKEQMEPDTTLEIHSISTSQNSGQIFVANRDNRHKTKIQCWKCRKFGHHQNNCRQGNRIEKKNYKSNGSSNANFASTASEQYDKDNCWSVNVAREKSFNVKKNDDSYIIDSGSTIHLSKDLSHFKNIQPFSGVINGISEKSLSISGKGSVEFTKDNDKIVLKDVLYVPDASQNLISVTLITGITSETICFDENSAYFSQNKRKIGSKTKDNLYYFDYQPVIQSKMDPSNNNLVNLTKAEKFEIDHAKLGHPSTDVMIKLGYSKPAEFKLCPACTTGKQTKSYSSVSTESMKINSPLSLIHSDLSGPFSTTGFKDEKYFPTIVDDFTRWTRLVPVKYKSDVAKELMYFIKMSENQFSSKGFKCLAVRTDNGGEFCSQELSNFFYEKGIVHQLTVPYNSHQNGVAERMHRSIKDKAKVLLKSSECPEVFWSEAVKTVEYLVNRLPTKAVKFTPFFHWNGIHPDYNFLHPFGCLCYVFIPPEKRQSTFSSTSIEGIFMGYEPNHKAYRCYIPSLQDIVISCNVKFDELVFPFKNNTQVLEVSNIPEYLPSDILFGSSAKGINIPIESKSCEDRLDPNDSTTSDTVM